MAFLDRARRAQDEFDGRLRTFGHGKYGRILRMARRPTSEEYVKVLEVTFLGAILIGSHRVRDATSSSTRSDPGSGQLASRACSVPGKNMAGRANEEEIGLLSGTPPEAAAKKPAATPAAVPVAPTPPTPAVAPKHDSRAFLSPPSGRRHRPERHRGSHHDALRRPHEPTSRTGHGQAHGRGRLHLDLPGRGRRVARALGPPGKRQLGPSCSRARRATPSTLATEPGRPALLRGHGPVGVRYGDQVEVRLAAELDDGNARAAHARLRRAAGRARDQDLARLRTRGRRHAPRPDRGEAGRSRSRCSCRVPSAGTSSPRG